MFYPSIKTYQIVNIYILIEYMTGWYKLCYAICVCVYTLLQVYLQLTCWSSVIVLHTWITMETV